MGARRRPGPVQVGVSPDPVAAAPWKSSLQPRRSTSGTNTSGKIKAARFTNRPRGRVLLGYTSRVTDNCKIVDVKSGLVRRPSKIRRAAPCVVRVSRRYFSNTAKFRDRF